tara:strand:+ start:84 stop:1739 length:1656 start_codon:yes stop_codon:yes gene_type:complete
MGQRGAGAAKLKQAYEFRKLRTKFPWDNPKKTRAQKVISFLQWLPITKGKLQGKKMRLLPDQKKFIEAIYGDLSDEEKRKVLIGIKSEPRGNGKTGLVTGLALCHLLGPESEVRGEVYSAAIDKNQAGLLFNEMEAIIFEVPEFAARVNIRRQQKQIEVLTGAGKGSLYEALSKDARRGHGLSPTLWIYDEIAQTSDRELLDNLITAMGKRKESLGLIISTQAPSDDHALSQLIDDGLSGIDESIYVQLSCAPENADPFDAETLKECNPAIGKFLDLGDLMKEADRAKRLPAFEPRFRNLRLNQRIDTNADARIVTAQVWKTLADPVDLTALEGRTCYAGLDLSGKHDLSALVLAFPDDMPDPAFDIVPFFWTPLGQMEVRTPSEQDLFGQWMREGLLEGLPGMVIRYGYIAQKLYEISQRFDLRGICFDRWRIDDLKAELEDIGIALPMLPFGQGFKDMGPAIERFAELALSGKLRHGGHKVLTASVANAIVVTDPAGSQKLDKGKSHRPGSIRIDGAVALTMALAATGKFREEVPTSPWEDPNYSISAG